MSQRIGIDNNSIQKTVSGARVSFDTRTTEQVEKTRDPANRKTSSPRRQKKAA